MNQQRFEDRKKKILTILRNLRDTAILTDRPVPNANTLFDLMELPDDKLQEVYLHATKQKQP